MSRKVVAFVLTFVAVVSHTCLADAQGLIAQYNNAFFNKDYQAALRTVTAIVAQDPGNLIFRREFAKMLAATNRNQEFIAEIRRIREAKDPNSVQAIWDVMGHPLVSSELRKSTKALFLALGDHAILMGWPADVSDDRGGEANPRSGNGSQRSGDVAGGGKGNGRAAPLSDGYQHLDTVKRVEVLGESLVGKKVKIGPCEFFDTSTSHVRQLPAVFVRREGDTTIVDGEEREKWVDFSFTDSSGSMFFYAFADKARFGEFLLQLNRGALINVRGTVVELASLGKFGIIVDVIEAINR